jgi:YVTN family beta-propeller protein
MVEPDGKRVYIASWFSNELLVMDVRTLEVVGRVPTGESPRAFGVFLARGG